MNKHSALEITAVQVWPVHKGESRIKAMATITVNDSLRLSGLRIVEGKNGLFVSWPSEKKAGTDHYFNFVQPVSREIGDAIQREVMEHYHRAVLAQAA
jgi:stage V sporulation protein G